MPDKSSVNFKGHLQDMGRENLGILNERFTHATGQTTFGMQTVMTNANHIGFLYVVA